MTFLLILAALGVLVIGVAWFTYRNRSRIESTVASAEAKAQEIKDVAGKL